jgi:hypothetical protein
MRTAVEAAGDGVGDAIWFLWFREELAAVGVA